MLSMKGREKYKKAVERMRALGCESQEEIIAGLENEVDKLREQVRGLLEKTEDCHLGLKKAICLHIAEGDTLIVKLAHFLKPEEAERTYEALLKQMQNRLIVLQPGVDAEIARGNSEKVENHRTPKEVEKAADEPKVHELKIMPEFYEAVLCGDKTFEIRKNDRGFIVGDLLALKEWDGENFTGRTVTKKISYMLADIYGLRPGYCVLGIVEPNVYEMCKVMEKILIRKEGKADE